MTVLISYSVTCVSNNWYKCNGTNLNIKAWNIFEAKKSSKSLHKVIICKTGCRFQKHTASRFTIIFMWKSQNSYMYCIWCHNNCYQAVADSLIQYHLWLLNYRRFHTLRLLSGMCLCFSVGRTGPLTQFLYMYLQGESGLSLFAYFCTENLASDADKTVFCAFLVGRIWPPTIEWIVFLVYFVRRIWSLSAEWIIFLYFVGRIWPLTAFMAVLWWPALCVLSSVWFGWESRFYMEGDQTGSNKTINEGITIG